MLIEFRTRVVEHDLEEKVLDLLLPASADAFVWHRLYQQELLRQVVPRGRYQPAWRTLRRPHRPLTYHGAHRMFERVNASLGADRSQGVAG